MITNGLAVHCAGLCLSACACIIVLKVEPRRRTYWQFNKHVRVYKSHFAHPRQLKSKYFRNQNQNYYDNFN